MEVASTNALLIKRADKLTYNKKYRKTDEKDLIQLMGHC